MFRSLAPNREMLDRYRKQKGTWSAYADDFLSLMKERKIQQSISREIIADGCLLCSEHKPDRCHRLVAEYLKEHWGDVEIVHLV